MYTSVYQNIMLVFDILHSDLMDSQFVLSSLKNFIISFLFSVHIKNMSSIALRQINENPLMKTL